MVFLSGTASTQTFIWQLFFPFLSFYCVLLRFTVAHDSFGIFQALRDHVLVFGLWCLKPLSTMFSFIGGGNRNIWRKPLTYHKWLTNLSHNVVWVQLAWAGFKLTTLVVMGTDCIDSYKSNYHLIALQNIFCSLEL